MGRAVLFGSGILWAAMCLACCVPAGTVPSGTGNTSGTSTDTRATKNKDNLGGSRLEVKIAELRYEDVKLKNGRETRKVYVDITNTGEKPVRSVTARIRFLDARSNRELFRLDDHFIYAVRNDDPGIEPGKTHIAREKEGDGFLVPFDIEEKGGYTVEVKIIRVEETVEFK